MAVIVVQGSYVVEPEDRDRFIEVSVEKMKSSRTEAGCLEYVMAADPADPGRVIVSERWESKEALHAHLNRDDPSLAQTIATRPKPISSEFAVFEVVESAL